MFESTAFLSEYLNHFFALKPKIKLLWLLSLVGICLTSGTCWYLVRETNRPPDQLQPTETTSNISRVSDLGVISVDVSGAVAKPGVYQLYLGQRVADAIVAAGGLSKDVDQQSLLEKTNLAEKVEDGQKVIVPFQKPTLILTQAAQINSALEVAGDTVADDSEGKVSLNQASLAELDALPGIGEKRAQDIIDQRPYSQLSQLVDKKVVSSGIFEEIKAQITL